MTALPIAKILSLTVRTVAKPISKILKDQAKQHATFRQAFLVPVGQLTHGIAVRIRRLTIGSSRRDVVPLDEAGATEYGAEFLGEAFIYSVATALMVTEYNSSAKKSAAKEARQNERLRQLEADLEQANATLTMQTQALRQTVLILEQQQRQQQSPTATANTSPASWFGLGVKSS
eukprot:TRINITY_DN4976_c0_g1_i2.p1 TRINITY_DN4976_c0_g1~~TRINITY_DN4976_c0_g1_i2.p1  ORF type:complete len:175 (+),score=31.26 TRINITY_DN4976_c0_g1_i2:75-599(+)